MFIAVVMACSLFHPHQGGGAFVHFLGGGDQLRLQLFAQGDGRSGERVLVRNLQTGQRFSALVQADGRLALAAPGA
jgi:flagella basal body P-ring formation protein FlgA